VAIYRDEIVVPVEPSENQKFYTAIQHKMVGNRVALERGDLTQAQHDGYQSYLLAAHEDVRKKLTPEELAATVVKKEEMTKEELAALQRELDKNKDKPSH
jgi:hypothetical protein